MEAIILAAGKGNRLGEVTGGLPKCYLELAGETLLARNLRLLRHSGVTKTVVVTGYERHRLMADFAGPDIEWVFNPFYEITNVLASFWVGMRRLENDFIYLHADTVFHPGVLEELRDTAGDFVLACDTKECGEEEMKYQLENGKLTVINKTMQPSRSRGEFLGLCKVAGGSLQALRQAVETILERGEFQAFFEMAIQELIDEDAVPVTVMDIGDFPWIEIDFPADYEAAKRLFS